MCARRRLRFALAPSHEYTAPRPFGLVAAAEQALRGLARGRHADRAADARAAETAVAAGVLPQVLLVVRLGVVEAAERLDLGRDLPLAGARQLGRVAVAGRLHGGALRPRREVDRGAVLGAVVVALAHALGRVVALPERL